MLRFLRAFREPLLHRYQTFLAREFKFIQGVFQLLRRQSLFRQKVHRHIYIILVQTTRDPLLHQVKTRSILLIIMHDSIDHGLIYFVGLLRIPLLQLQLSLGDPRPQFQLLYRRS